MARIIDEKRRDEILNGNLLPVIIAICAPLFLYNFLNACYALLDSVFVSKINSTSVSAVATLSQIKSLLSSLGAGLAGGGGIIIARYFGAKRNEEARKNANVLFTIGMLVVIVLYAICLPLAVPIMHLSGVPEPLIAIGTSYFIAQIMELGLIVFNNIFIAMQKAKGTTKLIFIMNIASMCLKITLNYVFIYGIGVQDIIWVEISSLISQALLFSVFLIVSLRKDNIFRIFYKDFSLAWKYTKPIILMAFPIFLGKFIFAYGKVSVNAMCGKYGALVVGALGVSNHICGLVTSPVNSIEEGESTIVSQNLGNNNQKRAMQTFLKSLIMGLVISTIGYILVRFVLQDWLIELFSQNEEAADTEEFLALIKSINRFDTLSIPALAINGSVLGLLYGFGQTKLSMILNISRVFVFRVPVLWYIQTFHKEIGAEAAGISMGISNICIAVTSLIFLGLFLLHLKKKNNKNWSDNNVREEANG